MIGHETHYLGLPFRQRRRHTQISHDENLSFLSKNPNNLICFQNSIIYGVVCSLISFHNLTFLSRYAQVAARNTEQTAEEASAPVPQTIIPNESLSSDAASYSTGRSTNGLDDHSSSQSGPGGVHVINRNQLHELNTNTQDQVIREPGPSITVNEPIIHDETGDSDEEEEEAAAAAAANGSSSFKEKLKKSSKKLSKKDKEIIKTGGIGVVNVIAMGAIGYWGWRKYGGGENGWKVVGILAGAWVGISALEFIGIRYVLPPSHYEDIG